MAKAKIAEIVDELQMQFDEWPSFLNSKTGKVVNVSTESLNKAELIIEQREEEEYSEEALAAILNDDDMEDVLKLAIEVEWNFENYIRLPDQFELDEYSMMEDFCYSIKNEKQSNALLEAISGKGAFRRFKDKIQYFGIQDDWYAYRDECLKQVAIKWCEANNIEYE